MTPLPTDATGPGGHAVAQRPGRSLGTLSLVLALTFGAGAIAVVLGHRFASEAVIDLGPTDSRYAQRFRDIERDGPVWFRWSVVPTSNLALPFRFCGPGTVSLRVRRHFVDPAILSVSTGGALLGQRSVRARTDQPYEVIQFPVSKISCDAYASVLLEATVENDRPLGVGVDWVTIEAPDGLRAASPVIARGGGVLALICGALWLSGVTIPATLAAGSAVALMMGFAFGASPVAAERMLRGGLPALLVTLALGGALLGLSGLRSLDRRGRAALVTLTLLTLLARSAFLHNQAFYPDYRVHALVQHTYNRVGLTRFLDSLFEIQYARSLGLQQIDGNWYPFPYPPGSYALTGLVGTAFRLDPLDASIATAAGLAALIPPLTAALGLSLGLGGPVSVIGACFVAIQPLLVRRMALGYFPGIAGQFADAIALLLLIAALRATPADRARRAVPLGLALLAGFLLYTQSIANFGLLIAALLAIEAIRRSPSGWKGPALVAAVAGLALGVSVWAFYGRYQPVLENVRAHRPQPESRILAQLEQARRAAPLEAAEADDLNDPFAGPTFDPARGLMRLVGRLWRFNGPFALVIALGAWLLWRQSDAWVQNLILAWGTVALWINLLAAGLPSPNGFQHLKDLEFVSPLLALAMGAMALRLWVWRPLAGVGLGIAWALFACRAFAVEWLDRLLPLAGR